MEYKENLVPQSSSAPHDITLKQEYQVKVSSYLTEIRI